MNYPKIIFHSISDYFKIRQILVLIYLSFSATVRRLSMVGWSWLLQEPPYICIELFFFVLIHCSISSIFKTWMCLYQYRPLVGFTYLLQQCLLYLWVVVSFIVLVLCTEEYMGTWVMFSDEQYIDLIVDTESASTYVFHSTQVFTS